MRKWLKIVIVFLYKSLSRVIIPHFFYQKCSIIQNLTPIAISYGIPKLLPNLHFKAIFIDPKDTNLVRAIPKLSHKILVQKIFFYVFVVGISYTT